MDTKSWLLRHGKRLAAVEQPSSCKMAIRMMSKLTGWKNAAEDNALLNMKTAFVHKQPQEKDSDKEEEMPRMLDPQSPGLQG